MSVDTACASGQVAAHVAASVVKHKECGSAVPSAVSLKLIPHGTAAMATADLPTAAFDREGAEKYIEQHKLHKLMGNLLRFAAARAIERPAAAPPRPARPSSVAATKGE